MAAGQMNTGTGASQANYLGMVQPRQSAAEKHANGGVSDRRAVQSGSVALRPSFRCKQQPE